MRKLLLVVGSLSIFGSVMVFGAGAASASPMAKGTGTCKFVAGKGTFNHPITLAGTAGVTTEKVKFKVAPANDCGIQLTFPVGGQVTGVASITGAGTYKRPAGSANSCTNFASVDIPKVKIKVAWTATPAIAPTTATFSTSAYTPANITLGTETAWAGSFTTTAASGKLVMSSTIPNLTACTAATSVSSFAITGEFIAV